MYCHIFLYVLSHTCIGYARSVETTESTNYNTRIISSFQDIFSILISDNFNDVQSNLSISVPEDAYLNISQLAKKYGYPFEEHTVVTDDGYIINFHRIPHGRDGQRNNIVVFLMHGIMDSSDSWVIQGPEQAFSYILADQGFDVWMGNARGNRHSPKHTKLNSTDPAYWKFTWEQIGIYDTTKMIDYILNVTGNEYVYYIGHSQGTTSFYVMNSLRPEYNEKVKLMFSLAPIAWVKHVRSPIIKMLSPAQNILNYLLLTFNIYGPSSVFFNKVSAYVCSMLSIKCKDYLTLIVGDDYRSINSTMMPIMLGHMFSGSSTFQFLHYGQLLHSGRFCRYDYGPEQNLKTYGDTSPPDYDLSKITVPVALFYSDNDWLSDPADVSTLKKHLPNVFIYEFLKGYNHLDYLYAPDVKELVYFKIIDQILKFENGEEVNFIQNDEETVD